MCPLRGLIDSCHLAFKERHCLTAVLMENISIGVEGDLNASMPEPCFQYDRRNAGLDTTCRKGVSQCMLSVKMDVCFLAKSAIKAVHLTGTDKRIFVIIIKHQLPWISLLLL